MKIILLLFICTLHPLLQAADRQVSITDATTNQRLTLTDEEQLNRFFYFWSQKQPIRKTSSFHWRYQLQLQDQSGQSRWVYDPAGYARKVSMDQASVIYRLNTARSLNRFLNEESEPPNGQ